MKKTDVKVGGVYAAKVTGKVVPVRLDKENPRGGWDATNTATGKKARIKSAQRLRPSATAKMSEAEKKALSKTNKALGGAIARSLNKKRGGKTSATKAEAEPKPGEVGLEVMRRRHAAKAAAAATAAAEKTPTSAPVAKKAGQATKDAKKTPKRDTGQRRGTSGKKKAVPKAKAVNAAMQAVGRAKKERASAINLAAKVLADAKEPLSCGEIMKRILDRKLWTTKGKTPAATLYSAILREIQAKGPEARFRKVERGKFALAV